MILLTNRVHPCAAPINMQRIRGEFHRLALLGPHTSRRPRRRTRA
jgi:hypothetical protein